MIRPATMEDIPRLVELGAEFYQETFLKDICPYDPISIGNLLQVYISQDNCMVLVLEKDGQIVGGICGVVVPLYWNNAVKAAQQIAWFVSAEHRGPSAFKLLSEYEKQAKAKGATVFFSGAKKNKSFDIMDAMLKRRGYRELESMHIKEA